MRGICKLLAARAVLLVTLATVSACATPHRHEAGTIHHVVVVWLKRPGNLSDKAQLVRASQDLAASIPQLRRLAWGEALPSDRAIVDDSFDLAFIMTFSDRAALEAYEKHPVHIRTTREVLRPLSHKVLVYDIACDGAPATARNPQTSE